MQTVKLKSLDRYIRIILYFSFLKRLPPSFYPGGQLYKKIRYNVCRKLFKYCGENVNIEPGAYIPFWKVEIGDNSGIGINARLGAVTIGRDVMMGPDVIILSRRHYYKKTDVPMNIQGEGEELPVTIEDDVWIGTRAIILPGVTIEKGAIIAAGSIVSSDVSKYTIVGGNPAKLIKKRHKLNDI